MGADLLIVLCCCWKLVLEWAVGIVVMVRCFSDKTTFDQEISDKLGRSFPRVAFITVLVSNALPLACHFNALDSSKHRRIR